jgi:Protein of unknown function (DUF2917)
MEHSHYPFATQDWSLMQHRALTLQASQLRAVESLDGDLWITIDGNCNDFFVKSGERINVPCRTGNVVIEPTSSSATIRVALAAQSPLAQRVGPSLATALSVSLLRPIANALCKFAGVLRKVAVQLDPKLSRA